MNYQCQIDGDPAEATIGPTELVVGARVFPYVELDEVRADNHRIRLTPVVDTSAEISHLGRNTDDFILKLRQARAAARRAALLQWTGDAPLATFESHGADEPITVVLFRDGLTVEPLNGEPRFAPFSLIENVERDGYRITLHLRGTDDVDIAKLGTETDLFLKRLADARNDLALRTADAYAALDPALAGFAAPDGWAVDAASSHGYFATLRTVLASGDRGDELAVLERLAGARLRLGVKAGVSGSSFAFALAP